MRINLRLVWLLGLGAPLAGLVASAAGPAPAVSPAIVKIEGLGWFGNREMKASLARLLGDGRSPVLDANAVEDAIFLLMSAIQDDGFLKPVIGVEITEAEDRKTAFTFDSDMTMAVPRGTAARALRLRVEPGVRYFVATVHVSGLQAVPEKTARRFFSGESALFTGKAIRAYTVSGGANVVRSWRFENDRGGKRSWSGEEAA